MTYLDREGKIKELSENFLIVKEMFVLYSYRLSFDLFYRIKKYLLFLGMKYLFDIQDIATKERKSLTLDEVIIKLQIQRIGFGFYELESTYQSANHLYDDFRKILLNRDHLKQPKKYYVKNYVLFFANVILNELDNTCLEEDAGLWQFKQLMRLTIKAFSEVKSPKTERRIMESYVDNSNIVKHILIKSSND